MAHPIKTGFGREPNRIVKTLLAYGINNKQDASTLDPEKGELVDCTNVDLANTCSTRKGYTSSSIPTSFTATSDNEYTNVNGTWITYSDLGTQFSSTDPHKMPMMNRRGFLEFYNGRVYNLISSEGKAVLYFSDMWSADSMDERKCILAVFESTPTMLSRTDDGLVVGTQNQIVYLQGNDPVGGSFKQTIVALYGAITNTVVRINGDKIESAKMQGRVSVFTTKQGICVVGNGGSFINLSLTNFSFPWSNQGAAFIREQEGQVYYVVSMNNATNDPYNAEVDTIEVTDSYV